MIVLFSPNSFSGEILWSSLPLSFLCSYPLYKSHVLTSSANLSVYSFAVWIIQRQFHLLSSKNPDWCRYFFLTNYLIIEHFFYEYFMLCQMLWLKERNWTSLDFKLLPVNWNYLCHLMVELKIVDTMMKESILTQKLEQSRKVENKVIYLLYHPSPAFLACFCLLFISNPTCSFQM